MKITFLENNIGSDRLILIFPGWSCDEELYRDFSFPGWDVAVVGDYSSPVLDKTVLNRYSTIYLFAWSLGVFMAAVAGFNGEITAAFAVNGTLIPADDTRGIPTETFRKTAENLSPRNLQKFRRRMAGSAELYRESFSKVFSEEETERLRMQLFSITDWQKSPYISSLPWRKVFISEEDAIFPPENMRRAWKEQEIGADVEIISLAEGHYVPLDIIVRYAIPNLEKVAGRFSQAGVTYDERAVAQRELAEDLCRHIAGRTPEAGGKILEIGPGTGIFTAMIIEKFRPREIDFVDISGVRPDAGEISSSFFQGDAEKWIAMTERRYDMVLSSATVQWFVNLPLFIRNVAGVLNKDGVFGFSTFLPGNLAELDSLRPSPIHYHSTADIIKWMKEYFDDVRWLEKEIVLRFRSPAELFSHLRETGVGGSAPAANLPLSVIRRLHTLTFRCACFSGIKKLLPITHSP